MPTTLFHEFNIDTLKSEIALWADYCRDIKSITLYMGKPLGTYLLLFEVAETFGFFTGWEKVETDGQGRYCLSLEEEGTNVFDIFETGTALSKRLYSACYSGMDAKEKLEDFIQKIKIATVTDDSAGRFFLVFDEGDFDNRLPTPHTGYGCESDPPEIGLGVVLLKPGIDMDVVNPRDHYLHDSGLCLYSREEEKEIEVPLHSKRKDETQKATELLAALCEEIFNKSNGAFGLKKRDRLDFLDKILGNCPDKKGREIWGNVPNRFKNQRGKFKESLEPKYYGIVPDLIEKYVKMWQNEK